MSLAPNNLLIYGVPATVAILWWFRRRQKAEEKKSAERLKIFDVLWSNNSRKCSASSHDPSTCDKYCHDVRIKRICSLLNEAKYSIDIAMHILTLNEISETFINAQDRGVKIRVVLCTTHRHSSGSQIRELYEEGREFESKYTKYEGIEVHSQFLEGERSMHHKFCIIDGEKRVKSLLGFSKIIWPIAFNSILLTGSCNWTKQGSFANWENIIVTNNKILLNSFEDEFEVMWKEFEKKSAISSCK